MWLSRNEPGKYPRGCGFDPWPPSVKEGSGVALSYAVVHRHSLHPILLWVCIGLQPQVRFDSYSGTHICCRSGPKKENKLKTKKNPPDLWDIQYINLSSCPLFLSLTPRSTNTQSYILPLPLTFHPADLGSLCHFILGWTKMHTSVSSPSSHPLQNCSLLSA